MTNQEIERTVWLKNQESFHNSKLVDIRRELRALNIKQIEEKLPFKRGDTISWHNGEKRGVFVETQTMGAYFGLVRFVVRRFRKDGSKGAEVLLFESDQPKLCNAQPAEIKTPKS
jgi:hypothetical protein